MFQKVYSLANRILLSSAVLALTSCATCPLSISPTLHTGATQAGSDVIQVTHYGRYTLVEVGPTSVQRDLFSQVVESTISDPHATLGDALHKVLQGSGFQLCTNPDIGALTKIPLPIVHHQLGPITLRDAIETLTGHGWRLMVDESNREICFKKLESTTHGRGL